MATTLRISSTCVVALDELEWRYSASGGPGGQHANRSNTRVELRFDVAGSPSLAPGQRARLLERVGPTVRIVVDTNRSQARNRDEAIARFTARLAEGLHVQTPRRDTKPSKAAKQRRLDAKRQAGERKEQRRWTPGND